MIKILQIFIHIIDLQKYGEYVKLLGFEELFTMVMQHIVLSVDIQMM